MSTATQNLTIEGLIAKYGAEKIAKTRAVYAGLSRDSLGHSLASWHRTLANPPRGMDTEKAQDLVRGIVFLMERDLEAR